MLTGLISLVDKTNAQTTVNVQLLKDILGKVLLSGVLDILCDYMGYYLFDGANLAAFIANREMICLFVGEHEIRVFARQDQPLPDFITIDLRPYLPIWVSLYDVYFWGWLYGDGYFGDGFVCFPSHDDEDYRVCEQWWQKNKSDIKESKDELIAALTETEICAELSLQLRSVFREAAGWPSFALECGI